MTRRSGRSVSGGPPAGHVWVAICAMSALAFFADRVEGQAYRGWLSTSLQMVEFRPVGLDSVSADEAAGDGAGGFTYEGYPVDCGAGAVCTGLLPLGRERTFLSTQDLGLTFWRTGVRGLSATTLVRVRSGFGGNTTWPRYDDEFDTMLAYAQLVRSGARIRAGRQELRSGLGFSRFDGLSGSLQRGGVRVEAYGGRSLARGLREPANQAARALDDFFVDHGVYLLGAAATLRAAQLSATMRYHREILADRSGLDGERAAVDFSKVVPRARITGNLDYDFSFQRIGKAHLAVTAPLFEGRWLAEAGARRYVPYFELSTIWGFFEPVSYSEVFARAAWAPRGSLQGSVSWGRRSYGDAGTPIVLEALEDTGWWTRVVGRWEPSSGWSIDGRYRLEWGAGAFLNSVDGTVRRRVSESLGISLLVASFQQFEEYRLGQGRAITLGGTVDAQPADRIVLDGGFSLTRHRDGGTVHTSPWNQSRAWTSLRWRIGDDPGLANRRERR